MTSLLDRLPADVAAMLSLAPGLAGVPIMGPSREPGAAAVADRVLAALGKGTLVEASGQVGLAIYIGELEADSAEMNLPSVVLNARLRVTVLENMLINQSGLSTLEAAVLVAGAMHHWSPGLNVLLLPDRPFFQPTGVGDADTMQPDPDVRGYEMTFRLPSFGLELPARTSAPLATYSDETGLLSLDCSDDAAAIWYTSDDQGGVPALPAPGEPSATLYTAPVAMATGTMVRVATYGPGLQPGQVLMMTL